MILRWLLWFPRSAYDAPSVGGSVDFLTGDTPLDILTDDSLNPLTAA